MIFRSISYICLYIFALLSEWGAGPTFVTGSVSMSLLPGPVYNISFGTSCSVRNISRWVWKIKAIVGLFIKHGKKHTLPGRRTAAELVSETLFQIKEQEDR
jgi:hypothetical protein